jgi:uncharacterized repeat protein (TIGR01451 family)
VRVVRRENGIRLILDLTQENISGHDLTGGFTADVASQEYGFWGTWNQGQKQWFRPAGSTEECVVDEDTCRRNCLVKKLSLAGISYFAPEVGAVLRAVNCVECLRTGSEGKCGACLASVASAEGVKWAPTANAIKSCLENCANEQFRQQEVCTKSRKYCGATNASGDGEVLQRDCDTRTCSWVWGTEHVYWCLASRSEVCLEDPFYGAYCCNTLTDGKCLCQKGTLCDTKTTESHVQGDPNALYGPDQVVPGETVTYTITYENVGDGTAYGVYVTSQLAPELDDSTLQMGGDAAYFPDSRLMIWDIGELGSHAPGEVTYQAQVPSTVISGTVIVNGAVVYFPSVPETTPTNDLVTIVRTVVAYSQRLETVEGVPLAITLTGSSQSGLPLAYTIVSQPLNGTLSGTPPNVTYTPATNFEGGDQFTFRVSDGLNLSTPAYVTIDVLTGAETIPPEVVSAWPQPHAVDVMFATEPISAGMYLPNIWAQFDEPLDAATLTAGTMYVTDGVGRHLAGQVTWDGTQNRATFVLGEPLASEQTCTARVTTGVHDTSGNALAADFVWSFTTRQQGHIIYLPLVLRKH